jgi:hypothetical protein
MSDPTRDQRLEELLRSIGRDRPRPVDLADPVLARLTAAESPAQATPATRARPRRRRVLAIAAVALLTVAGCVAIPPVRHAIEDLFRSNGLVIKHAPSTTSSTVGSASTQPTPTGLVPPGTRTDIPSVERYSGGRLLVPPGLGQPSEVYRLGALVTLIYRTGGQPAWVIMEVVQPSRVLLEKILSAGASATPVQVNGHDGIWVNGPQELIYVGPAGQGTVVDPVLSGHTLIWEQGGVTVRIESPRAEAEVLTVAAQLR